MQAILDDLTMDDYFSIVDFNHNVRCWSEDLVPGSSIQVEEAKSYIRAIKPNGGKTPPPPGATRSSEKTSSTMSTRTLLFTKYVTHGTECHLWSNQ